MTVDLIAAGGRIAAFAQEVRACALGPAAAAVLGAHVTGRARVEILVARLQPARSHKSRHASILVPFEATLAALDAIGGRSG